MGPGALRQVRGECEFPLGVDRSKATRARAATKEEELGAVRKGARNGRHGGRGLLFVVVLGEADLGPGRGGGGGGGGKGEEEEGEEAAHGCLFDLGLACAGEGGREGGV